MLPLKSLFQASLDKAVGVWNSSALYALVFQGVGGLIQVMAFLLLHGKDYLGFSRAFLEGTVLSTFLVLNFENTILGGKFSASVSKYFVFFWMLGMAAVVIGAVLGEKIPNFLVFCCWGVCCRIFLSWAASRPTAPARLFSAGLLVIVACVASDLNCVMAVSLLAMSIAGPEIFRIGRSMDGALLVEIRCSAAAFVRYLPHTVSGLMLGYFDRYLALNVVGGSQAELYLRTVQICSWAAFTCYPIVFAFRNRILASGEQSLRNAFSTLLILSAVMAASIGMILIVLSFFEQAPAMSAFLLLFCFLATIFSQFYQVASILNFVREKFLAINRITLLSGCVSLAIGVWGVMRYQTAITLAVMFMAGWFTQVVLTVYSLKKKHDS